MDKYEYRIKAEEINALIEKKEYAQAVKIADGIDWRRVRSVVMLCKVSELYKMNRRYEDSKEVLLLAYDLQPGSRKIVYSLCELSIKLEETVQAVEYYKEFIQIAPRDTGRFILQYRLYEAQDVSLEERIAVLEEYKKRDYREKWAYELAYLYHRIGLATRCVEECDELILWFGEGKYVIKAMELKMLHAPLTPQQQEKYNARFMVPAEEAAPQETEENASESESIEPSLSIEIKSIEATRAKTAKIPTKKIKQEMEDETEGEYENNDEYPEGYQVEYTDPDAEEIMESGEEELEAEEASLEAIQQSLPEMESDMQDSDEEASEQQDNEQEDSDIKIAEPDNDLDIQVKMIDVGDQYNTINLQEELAKNLAKMLAEEDMEATDATKALPIESIFQATAQNLTDGEVTTTTNEPVHTQNIDGNDLTNKNDSVHMGDIVEINSDNQSEMGDVVEIVAAENKDSEESEVAETEESAEAEVEKEESAEAEAETEEAEESEEETEEEAKAEAETEEETETEESEETETEESSEAEAETEEAEESEEETEEEAKAEAETEEETETEESEETETEESAEAEAETEKKETEAETQEEAKEEEAETEEETEEETETEESEETETEESAEAETETEEAKESEEDLELGEIEEIEEIEDADESEEEVEEEQQINNTQEEKSSNNHNSDKNINEIEPLLFGKNEPLPEALIQAVQNVALEAAKEAARQAAQEAAQATVEAIKVMKPDLAIKPENETTDSKDAESDKTESNKPESEKQAETTEPEEMVDKQITGQLSFNDIMAEWEETKRANEEKHLAEMKQRVLEQTGPLLSDFDAAARASVQSDLNMLSPMLDVFSNSEGLATEVESALNEDIKEEHLSNNKDNKLTNNNEESVENTEEKSINESDFKDYKESGAYEDNEYEDSTNEQEELSDTDFIAETESEEVSEPEANPEPEEFTQLENNSNYETLVQEPEDVQAENDTVEDRPNSFNTAEINGLEEKLMDALDKQHYDTASIPKAIMEQEMAERARKAAELAMGKRVQTNDENSSAQQMISTNSGNESDNENNKQQSRLLTKAEKEIFGPIAQTKELQEQIAYALDMISMVPFTGNIIVTGEKGTGASEIAQGIITELNQTNEAFNGKYQIYTSSELQTKDMEALVKELANGALIIEDAGNLPVDLYNKLIDSCNRLQGQGFVIILVDTKQDIDKLAKSYYKLSEYFNSRIDIVALDNDGLVNFGKEYANQKEYSIDDMGVLALYNRIEERQTNEHAVTVAEVKDIINEAILKAEKKNVSHFMDVIFAKRYDKDDMIVLREKDFLNEKEKG